MFSSIILDGYLPSARSMLAAATGSEMTTAFGTDLTDIVCACACACACVCVCVGGGGGGGGHEPTSSTQFIECYIVHIV